MAEASALPSSPSRGPSLPPPALPLVHVKPLENGGLKPAWTRELLGSNTGPGAGDRRPVQSVEAPGTCRPLSMPSSAMQRLTPYMGSQVAAQPPPPLSAPVGNNPG